MARYALVIGIAEYISPSLPRLSKTTNDAEAIAQLLEKYGDFQSVQRLPQRWNKEKNGYEIAATKATGAQIGQELRTFLLEKATNNEALIYFSGHGFTISDNLGQQKGYLASSDCQIELKETQSVEQKYGIPLDSLNELIRDSQLSSLVMLLDCCHSGYFLERQLIERTLTAFSSQKDYYLITACRSFERAGAIKSEEYSIFTGAVIQGLAAENAGSSKKISGDRLFDFVSQELKGSVQEPIRMGWGRAITLVTYPQVDVTPVENTVTFNRENPYRGLYAFDAAQAKYFCGREQAVRTLISRLADSRFLAVIGYSGSGKSSLVKAGLLPQLKSDRFPGSSQWEIASFTPGEHPLGKLVDILTQQQQQNQTYVLLIDQFEEIFTLCQDEAEREAFIRLLVQEVRKAGVETRIIITIRGDFLNRCAEYIDVVSLINSVPPTSFIVTPMSVTELEEAIEKPAKLHGVGFERGLVSQIVADILGQPGALPLLQYALKELWRVCIETPESPQPILTCKGYAEIGGVKGALDKRATILYLSLTTVDQEFVRRLFMELVQLGEAGEVTRRRVTWEKLTAVADSPQQLQKVVGLLAGSQQRLIITDEKTVEVAHEALLSEWKLLNKWVAENQENIRLSRSLEEDFQEWKDRFNKSDDALLSGAKLAVIAEWVNKTQPRLTPEESEFFHKSLEKRDREIQAQLEQERQLRELAESRQKEAEARSMAEIEKAIAAEDKAQAEAARAKAAEASAKYQKQRTRLAIASATLIALCGGLGAFTWQISTKNTLINKIASGALVQSPELFLQTGNQLDAMIATVQSLKQFQDLGIDNADAIKRLKLIIESVKEHNRLEGHKDRVWGVSFSPDGKIASASSNNEIKIWDKDGRFLYDLPGHKNGVWSVRFSHNGNFLASTSQDSTVKLWKRDSNKYKLMKNFDRHKDTVYDVAFSSDDKIIASAGRDGIIYVWRIESTENLTKPIATLNVKDILQKQGCNRNECADIRVNSIDFDPDDISKLAYVGTDGSVTIWDWEKKDSREIIGTHGHYQSVYIVRFSLKKQNLLASADKNGTIYIWNTKSNRNQKNPIAEIKDAHKGIVYGLDFTPDAKVLASGGDDETVKIWDVDKAIKGENPLITTLKAHTAKVNRLEFSPDGQTIASSSNDGTVRLWKWERVNLTKNATTDIKDLLKYSCDFLADYLRNNKNIPDWLNYQSGNCSIK